MAHPPPPFEIIRKLYGKLKVEKEIKNHGRTNGLKFIVIERRY